MIAFCASLTITLTPNYQVTFIRQMFAVLKMDRTKKWHLPLREAYRGCGLGGHGGEGPVSKIRESLSAGSKRI